MINLVYRFMMRLAPMGCVILCSTLVVSLEYQANDSMGYIVSVFVMIRP